MEWRYWLALGFGCVAGCVAAQTVYESRGEQGRVYSDRPSPGSRPVQMRPLNVVEPVAAPAQDKAAEAAGSGRAGEAPATYRTLAVVFPEADGSVAINNATFQVNLRSDPPLQLALGHAFSVRLNGRQVPGRYTTTEFMIPPEFFGDAMPVAVQRYQLDAFIVDASGNTLISAAPVQFNARYVTILQNPNYRLPQTPPTRPQPPPATKPRIEDATSGRRIANPDR